MTWGPPKVATRHGPDRGVRAGQHL
jgi:hypothetical protein